jgi:hypothetical protein
MAWRRNGMAAAAMTLGGGNSGVIIGVSMA